MTLSLSSFGAGAYTDAMQVCPMCGIDDFVSTARTPEGQVLYSCERSRHGDLPYLWTVDHSGSNQKYPAEGLAADLNLFDDLRKCFDEGDGWVEYGVLEDRFRIRFPENFENVRGIYGSVLLDGPRKYSAASYISRHVLSPLSQWGELDFFEGPATGVWSYTGRVGYWATTPVPSRDKVLTFATYEAESF